MWELEFKMYAEEKLKNIEKLLEEIKTILEIVFEDKLNEKFGEYPNG